MGANITTAWRDSRCARFALSGMLADIFPGNDAVRKGGAMTLYELSLEYARAAAALRERLRQVEALRAVEEGEQALMLDARLRLLRSMWRDTRATAAYLEHYYQRGGKKT